MLTRIITPDASDWPQLLAQVPHDIYHKPQYVRLCAKYDAGEPAAFVAAEGESLFFVPLLFREIPPLREDLDGHFDAVSPYGYPCPLSNSTDARFLQRALQQMMTCLRERNVVSAFLRLHPLLASPLEELRQIGTVIQHGETVFYDLSRPDDELWKDVRRTTRQAISRARRRGFVAAEDHQWQHLDDFIEVYWESMRRVAADDAYFFPAEYFYELKDSLSESVHLLVVSAPDGQFVAGALNTEVGGIAQAHLTGYRTEYIKHRPLKMLVDAGRQWASERGSRWFHIGGGLGGKADSLFEFKAALATGRADFFTWRAVVNAEAFQTLVSQWEQQAGSTADDRHGFFPPYRKQIPQTV